MTSIKYILLLVFPIIFLSGCDQNSETESPGSIAEKVANRLIEETTFEFVPALSAAVQEGAYYIDFFDCFGNDTDGLYYAHAKLHIDNRLSDAPLQFGISHSPGTVIININGRKIYRGVSTTPAMIRGLDYDILEYENIVSFTADDSISDIMVKMKPSGDDEARIYIGFINPDGRQRRDIQLSPFADIGLSESVAFLAIGPFNGRNKSIDTLYPPDTMGVKIGSYYDGLDERKVFWDIPRVHLVSRLPDPLDYADWRYFTGTFLDALDVVSQVFTDLNYYEYIDRHLDFFLDNYEFMEAERNAYGLLRTPFGHYFRFSLLDDVCMQGVPFIERLARTTDSYHTGTEQEIVDRIAGHIMNDALRLEDGTFCRINPDSMTIWADDLFMGTVFLTRLSELTGNIEYLKESIRQTLLFDSYLQDEETGLYWHGWFSRTSSPSSSKWARANGWVMMAKTELLKAMPESHPQRDRVLAGFQKQAEGIKRVQSSDGRWHQILDNPDTYLETSATAMFVRAFSKGLLYGWLSDNGFRSAAENGWKAVAEQVRDDGSVEGIVRGTPIMFSDEEYHNHPPRLHDPRGLGAVLYAAAALQQLYSNEEHLHYKIDNN